MKPWNNVPNRGASLETLAAEVLLPGIGGFTTRPGFFPCQ